VQVVATRAVPDGQVACIVHMPSLFGVAFDGQDGEVYVAHCPSTRVDPVAQLAGSTQVPWLFGVEPDGQGVAGNVCTHWPFWNTPPGHAGKVLKPSQFPKKSW